MKSVLITGCSSGIGYAAAHLLHRQGWRVFASCRKAEDVARLQAEGLTCLQLDITDDAQIRAAFAQVTAATGGTLDALFCNAGFGQPGAVEDISRAALQAQFDTNVFGTWMCINEAMHIFRRQNHGRILVNSSILGFAAMSWRGAYNSSKFALEGLCDTLRNEVYGSGIHVSLLEPGPISSRFRAHALTHFQKHIDTAASFHREAYKAQLARLQSEGDNTPFTLTSEACAEVCARALNAARPKARYRVTVPTQVFWYLKRLLPTALLDYCLRRAVGSEGK
ncbi:NAD(P)-dependent dehydrogenase (short-subunit alcohol dehydrogenase family) [Neisseria sp. HSC-16F19]|nr:SDR family NAD(P)-dependent oxidoreductase [Neisseria sp. HSC-16F19]MCP2041832.1 NAD(P)-dependent dehydrogenase (short-subunit alcohol dehydrogenase family) [Neisseria sp. HSC-16F19]